MLTVYFLRHGLAGDRETWEGDDSLRPLTKKGHKMLKDTGETLNLLGITPDLLITSPLVRAKETAEDVADYLDLKTKDILEDERLAPGFNKDALGEILKDHPDIQSVMVVGHEPDFSETVSALIGGGSIDLKKGGLARVDIPDANTLQGDLVWLLPPKVLTL